MAELRDAGAVGVSDDGVCVMSSAVMRRALEYAKNFDLPVIQHAEDHDADRRAPTCTRARSRRGSGCAAGRASPRTSSSRATCCSPSTPAARYHVAHVSTLGACALDPRGQERAACDVTCEVTPHHLLLTDAALLGYDTACKVNPPLREPRRRRGAARGARRRHDRRHRHRPRAALARSRRTASSPRRRPA